ncbi:MAG: urease subunit beta [Paenibacillaceae bacterium]
MIPGQYRVAEGEIIINEGRLTTIILIINKGDRPIQVGSHYHFYEVNRGLEFDRLSSFGMRLNIPAGTAVRFEPGEEKPVELVAIGGLQHVYGLNRLTNGSTELPEDSTDLTERLDLWKEGTRL